MSLYWEHVLSNSPTQQNVDHSGLGATTAAAQQNNTPANWDYINLGSAPPQSQQQQQYHWGQHVGAHVDTNRGSASPAYDPYGAAVMGGYQQGVQNVVYPYQQQQQHEGSPNCYVDAAASQTNVNQPVDQNYYYQQQQYQQQQIQLQQQQHHHQQQQQQQQQQQKPAMVPSPPPVMPQQVQHTLLPTRQHTQPPSHQPRPVEPQSVVLPSQPPAPFTPPPTTSFTPPTSYTPPSNAPALSEPQSLPFAVISPAVALPTSAVPQSTPFPTVLPFNSRSSPQQQLQGYNGTVATPPIAQEASVGRSSGNGETSRRSSLSYLAVQPLLSVQSPPAAPVVSDVARVDDSAQVTPESTYSVDTFGSGLSSTDHNGHHQGVSTSSAGAGQMHQQNAVRAEDNWEDDWERTEHPERGGAREVTPSDVASQTQSEPPGYPSSFPDTPCATREGSVAPTTETDAASYRSSDTQLTSDVARVAPVSAASTPVVGVPRHEEASRSQEHVPVAVAQVAPLRPEPESIQAAPPPPVTSASAVQMPAQVDGLAAGTANSEPVVSPPQTQMSNEGTAQLEDPDVSVAISLPSEANTQPSERTQPAPRTTPEPTTAESVLSPVTVQATSTPISSSETKKDAKSNDVRKENRETSSREPEEPQSQPNAHSGSAAAAAEHSDSTTGSLSTRNGPERRSVQSRYKKFKEHFSGIMGRLDQYRAEPSRSEFRSSSRTGNPLMANAANSHGRRSVLAVAKNPTQSRSDDASRLYNSKTDEGNISLFSQPDPLLDISFDSNRPAVYGDDFVDAARRSRLSRLSRPSSRAKADYPESGEQFESRTYGPSSKPYPGHYPSGRRSAHGSMGANHPQEYYVQQSHMYKERRRPQSSYDARAMERFQRAGGRYGYYDAYDDAHSSVSEESDSDDPERGDSEEEMRKYNRKGRHAGDAVDPYTIGEEMYYFGAIHLDQARVRSILLNDPPPPEYHRLPPIEKAAYLFYVAVYKKQYNDLGDFHRKFNREYFKYTCDGDADNIALWKICKSMQEEYLTKKLAESQKAYEASQRQLFSDERESVDGKEYDFVPLGERPRRLILRTNSAPNFMSERASMDENHDDRTSDILSIESSQRAPLKHRVPHAFVTFGAGGKMVTVHPDLSVSVVQIDDIKTVITDPHTLRLIDSAQTFKGPLLVGETPTHSVRLYIERQIKRIKNCEVASENPRDNDVIDCLLIWQLLGVIVQQQGRVTGPDVARLLVEIGSGPSRTLSSVHQHHSHRERNSTPTDSPSTAISPLRSQATDTRAYDRFTELLLGGHIQEAIESAIRDGLYADAMLVARRLLSHDAAKLIEIEERFLATRPQCNPVVTLVSVATKKHVPILMNPTSDDSGSWRTHAAIVLANLSTQEAMDSVYDLGKVLAKRDYNNAADFCFLAVAVLAGVNPFKTLGANPDDGVSRQHITLIHAGLPDDELETMQCRYGFSLTDLHATEIFDYAIRLSGADAYSPLGESVEYQRRRLQYAQLIAEFGGFATDAFRYCVEIARSIWNYYHLLTIQELTELCDLAERLRFAASANDWETSWTASLRAMIQQRKQYQSGDAPQVDPANAQPSAPAVPQTPYDNTQATTQQPDVMNTTDDAVTAPEQPELSSSRRSRSESLAAEARDWHAQRQDPLQMSPVAPPHSPVVNSAVEDNGMPVSRSRTQSNASQQGYTIDPYSAGVYVPPVVSSNAVTQRKGSMDEAFTNSEDTSARSTAESTPIRTMNQHAESASPVPQTMPDLSHIPQMPVVRLTPPQVPQTTTQPAQHQPQSQPQPQTHAAHATQPNGLPDSNLKKSSSQGSKGFFGNMKEKLLKAIPSGNEMILPDDSKPTIVWDPVKGRYVGAGVEEETTAAPPPKMDNLSSANSSSGGLRAARTSGGSRYFNPLNQASTNGAATPTPAAPVPAMPIPTQFGFIPTMPDDAGESVDPFSGQANPTVHGVEVSPAQ
ncbi:hypothetical protein Aduo_019561 [Ancylostoma duodenale]